MNVALNRPSYIPDQHVQRPTGRLLCTVRQRRQSRNAPAELAVRSHPDGHEPTIAALHGYKVFINYNEKLTCTGPRKLRARVSQNLVPFEKAFN